MNLTDHFIFNKRIPETLTNNFFLKKCYLLVKETLGYVPTITNLLGSTEART